MAAKRMPARFAGRCHNCQGPIAVGDMIDYERGVGARHAHGCRAVPQSQPSGLADHPDLERVTEYLYAQSRAGTLNEFTASLLKQFERNGRLSQRQIEAVVRKIDKPAKAQSIVVPDGRYAIQFPAGPRQGEWGLFRVWVGTRYDPPPVHVYEVRGTEKGTRLDKGNEMIALTLIARDPGQAAIDFGHRTGSCSRCGKELDVNLSRELGIGPTCMKHWFDNDTRLAKMAVARENLRARGLDPADKFDDLVTA